MEITKTYLKDLVYRVTGAAIEVHKVLGPGLLESVYHKCLKHELTLRGIKFKSEINVPINFKGLQLNTDLRCDLFVEDILPVELKSTEGIHPLHEAQIITYTKLIKVPEGVLFNFNVTHLYKEGQRTYVNELFRDLPE
ncbi:MAG: GxxExxY protein [Bacteroidetes bacterium 4572_114]|nr:MAG: GxxExxY protein [Bacteroidetes bacterium 4572_114]